MRTTALWSPTGRAGQGSADGIPLMHGISRDRPERMVDVCTDLHAVGHFRVWAVFREVAHSTVICGKGGRGTRDAPEPPARLMPADITKHERPAALAEAAGAADRDAQEGIDGPGSILGTYSEEKYFVGHLSRADV